MRGPSKQHIYIRVAKVTNHKRGKLAIYRPIYVIGSDAYCNLPAV